ncbi:hypothetical protein PIB30_097777 [Stylosanthes scabra]|uniref:SCP domain-containing protein n=1 Tax=Stylosanthes scabra TaxID=79078 RepID=A0ABU6VXF9_9FABA|nr:hypothetical protein [Stylosanthes scabra]
MWDKKLESHARNLLRKHIKDCQIWNADSSSSKYCSTTLYSPKLITGVDAVAYWVKMKENYDYEANTCIKGHPRSCVPYLYIVWNTTTSLGCARVECHNNKGTLVRCSYEPRSNILVDRPYPNTIH